MPKINKVVTTVWWNKKNMRELRRVFPEAQFVYVDFYDKERLAEEAKDADAAIIMGDVDPCLLGENSLQWIQCDHAGLNGSARRFEAGEPLLNLMRPSDAVSGKPTESGWARMMNSGLTKEQIAAMPLDKVLGERGWRDPSEWM